MYHVHWYHKYNVQCTYHVPFDQMYHVYSAPLKKLFDPGNTVFRLFLLFFCCVFFCFLSSEFLFFWFFFFFFGTLGSTVRFPSIQHLTVDAPMKKVWIRYRKHYSDWTVWSKNNPTKNHCFWQLKGPEQFLQSKLKKLIPQLILKVLRN